MRCARGVRCVSKSATRGLCGKGGEEMRERDARKGVQVMAAGWENVTDIPKAHELLDILHVELAGSSDVGSDYIYQICISCS